MTTGHVHVDFRAWVDSVETVLKGPISILDNRHLLAISLFLGDLVFKSFFDKFHSISVIFAASIVIFFKVWVGVEGVFPAVVLSNLAINFTSIY